MFNPHLETNFELNPWKLIINDFFPYESKRSFGYVLQMKATTLGV